MQKKRPNSPSIILVHPQMGANIGAAARAMLNFGLADLRIVNPRDGWPNAEATANSSGALDIIEPQIFETFESSIADLQTVYATTARPRDMVKPVSTPKDSMQNLNGKTGFVFGRERTGLENDHIALCHGIIEIPTNPDFSSLNLAQAVLVLCYEWGRSKLLRPRLLRPPADHKDMMAFLERLESELEERKFFREENLKPTMINNIRTALTRAHMTDQEVRTFHGVVSALIGNKSK